MEIRMRMRLLTPSPKRLFDSMDVCPSVLASFFARALDRLVKELGLEEDDHEA
jgi:hypothetical protein